MVGILVSMSAVQGGPGFPNLLPVVYDYLSKGQYNPEDICIGDVPDYQVRALLTEVCCYCIHNHEFTSGHPCTL